MKTETIGMITLMHQMFIPKLLLIAVIVIVSVYESEYKRGDDYTLFRPIHLRHVVLWNVFFLKNWSWLDSHHLTWGSAKLFC